MTSSTCSAFDDPGFHHSVLGGFGVGCWKGWAEPDGGGSGGVTNASIRDALTGLLGKPIGDSSALCVPTAHVLLVDGGDAAYLCHWMRHCGLAGLLPSLSETVWVGVSAGSMVMTPRIGDDFVSWRPPGGDDRMLGVVGFSIFPHLGHELMPENTMAEAERWAAGIAGPAYAIDDQTAIKVTGGTVEVISEGRWKLIPS